MTRIATVALRRHYGTAFRKARRHRVECRRTAATRWTCRVSWRYKRSGYRGRVLIDARPRPGYSVRVRVRRHVIAPRPLDASPRPPS